MKTLWIETGPDFNAIAKSWDQAVFQFKHRTVFMLSSFIQSWWKVYHTDYDLRIFALQKDSAILGGFPLCQKKRSIRTAFRRLWFYTGGISANYTEPFYLTDRGEFMSLFLTAISKRSDMDMIFLNEIREKNSCFPYPSSAPVKIYAAHDHDNYAVDLRGGTDSYYKSFISKKLRKDLKSKRRKLEKDFAAPRLTAISTLKDIHQAFEYYIQFSKESFRLRNKKSNIHDEKYQTFLRTLFSELFLKALLKCHVLKSKNQIIAVSFGYVFNHQFDWILTAYNHQFHQYRPGYLLIQDLIHENASQHLTLYNWFGYDRLYKRQFCNLKSPLLRVRLFKPTLLNRLIYRCEKSLRQHPYFKNILKSIMARFRTLSKSFGVSTAIVS